MLKKLFASVLLTVTIMSASAASEFAKFESAVKVLYSNDTAACSVVFVTPTSALTAGHCATSPKAKLEVRDGEEVYPVTFFIKDEKRDIATLFFTENFPSAVTVVPVATVKEVESLVLGEPLIALGYPGSPFRKDLDQLFILDGRFLGKRNNITYSYPSYSTTIPFGYGMSGGGTFAKFDGEWKLIGINIERDPRNLAPEGVTAPIYN